MLLREKKVHHQYRRSNGVTGAFIVLLLPLHISLTHAETSKSYFQNVKQGLGKFIAPEPTRTGYTVDINQLSKYQLDTSRINELPQVTSPQWGQTGVMSNSGIPNPLDLNKAVHTAVQRRPEITQSISTLSSQIANIDVAKAGYYPQLSGGIGTADLTKGE